MKRVTDIGRSDLARIKAFRDKASPGLFSCADCRDTGLVYARRVKYGKPILGVVPCPMCARGGDKHIQGNACAWAQGGRSCSLCGAHEGEQIPANYIPRLPVGFLSFDEVARLGQTDPIEDPQEVDDDIPF